MHPLGWDCYQREMKQAKEGIKEEFNRNKSVGAHEANGMYGEKSEKNINTFLRIRSSHFRHVVYSSRLSSCNWSFKPILFFVVASESNSTQPTTVSIPSHQPRYRTGQAKANTLPNRKQQNSIHNTCGHPHARP